MGQKNINILGIHISALTFDENINAALAFLRGGGVCRMIFTPNPEVVMRAREDKDYAAVLNAGDLILADGIGIIIASRLLKTKIPERTPGIDFITALFSRYTKAAPLSVFFFGGAPGTAKRAAANVSEKYPGVIITGYADGYYKEKTEQEIIAEIADKKPDLVLVGIGFPAQENWIFRNREKLNAKAAIACGGTLDVLAGDIKRAPVFFRKSGLEWFYRLITQPKRFFRMLKLPLFLVSVIKYNLTKGETK